MKRSRKHVKHFKLLKNTQESIAKHSVKAFNDRGLTKVTRTTMQGIGIQNTADHDQDFSMKRSVFTEATFIPIPIKVQLVRLVPSTRRRTAILIRKL